jgi:glycosyltransferase involved in cell wall biosynthesis
MSTGIPIISTECTPKSQRIDGGSTIVPIDDADALAEAMEKIMDQDYDGVKLSEQIMSLASPQIVGKQLEQLFTEIINS